MALLAIGLVAFTSTSLLVAVLLAAWGFFGTAAPVGWGTWVSRHISDDAEAGGGLSVAVIQLGIAAGAAGGGYLFDTIGWWGPFALATIILAASSTLALAASLERTEDRCMTSLQLHRRTVLVGSLATIMFPPMAFGQQGRDPANQEPTNMKVRFLFDRHTVNATLYDNPSARDFASMLPLDLKIEDYSTNEKIAYLPRKLTEEGSGPFGNEQPGDVCYYAPWGDVILFYASSIAIPAV